MKVTEPDRMNKAFADAFNSREVERLLVLYEPQAVLRTGAEDDDVVGHASIREALQGLLRVPGRMTSRNVFCLRQDDLALLRAEWEILDRDGRRIAAGQSAEVVRRQTDGRWLYRIDHATGCSLDASF